MRTHVAIALFFGLPLALATGPRVIADAAAPDPADWRDALVADWAGGPPEEVLAMRVYNPEYDLMSRTFLVLALADQAHIDEAERGLLIDTMDAIIADTLEQVETQGMHHYLLSYGRRAPFSGTGRSVFIDGELLVMMGARRLVQDDRWQAETSRYAAHVVDNIGAGSELPIAESYPDEAWAFCNAMAHLGLRMHEELDGADHHELREAFVAWARTSLVHEPTGLLSSELDLSGRHHDGPEGSSIWFVTTALQVIDPDLAGEQYELARAALGGSVLGLGYAREWPEGHGNIADIDSGPIVPFIEASASSSGLAIAAARAHGDTRWSGQLEAALGAAEIVMAGMPHLAELADNPVGQGVILWGLGFGPTWEALGPPAA